MKININDGFFEYEIEGICTSCSGTGLYSGMAERDGAYVVCSSCDGTGKRIYTGKHNIFKERKIIKDGKVKRVFSGSGGYCVGSKDVTTDDGVVIEFSKYGCDYNEFLNGKDPGYIESLCCPASANQGSCHKIDGFLDKCQELNNGYLNYFPKCEYINNKSKCWDRYKEKLHGEH